MLILLQIINVSYVVTNEMFQDSQPPPPLPVKKPEGGTGNGTTGEDYLLYGGGRDGLIRLFSIKFFFQLKNYNFSKVCLKQIFVK